MSLTSLPRDALWEIFNYLQVMDLRNLAQVSRAHRQIRYGAYLTRRCGGDGLSLTHKKRLWLRSLYPQRWSNNSFVFKTHSDWRTANARYALSPEYPSFKVEIQADLRSFYVGIATDRRYALGKLPKLRQQCLYLDFFLVIDSLSNRPRLEMVHYNFNRGRNRLQFEFVEAFQAKIRFPVWSVEVVGNFTDNTVAFRLNNVELIKFKLKPRASWTYPFVSLSPGSEARVVP